MERIVVPSGEFDWRTAQIFAAQALCRPGSVFSFATGDTTGGVFAELVRLREELNIDFSRTRAVNLDEYVGVEKDDPAGCYYRILHSLYRPLGIAEDRFYVPVTSAAGAEEECRRFTRTLKDWGGIDLMLLSIGRNGHIAFNEPGTPFGTEIHVAALSSSTIEAKTPLFGGSEKVPRCGITMGISTVMQARRIVLAARGAHKKDIIRAVLEGPVTETVPASVLRLHPCLSVILDEAAAG
ncbi:glucosamine-6-phosphate deaminase 1 [Spirochaetia bacterium]|nr:glucosamine-6-phosphate deaminase 1 [Spirochaetia bacterium]